MATFSYVFLGGQIPRPHSFHGVRLVSLRRVLSMPQPASSSTALQTVDLEECRDRRYVVVLDLPSRKQATDRIA